LLRYGPQPKRACEPFGCVSEREREGVIAKKEKIILITPVLDLKYFKKHSPNNYARTRLKV